MATTTPKRKASTKRTTKSGTKKTVKKSAQAKTSSKSTSSRVKKTVKVPARKSDVKKSEASTTGALAAEKTTTPSTTSNKKFDRLNIWNYAMAALHTIQGAAVLILSGDSLFPVNTSFITRDALASSDGAPVLVQAQHNLFNVNLAYLVAAFFFLSALAHLYIASIGRKRYESQLESGMNKARWYEYALSASVMMVAIAMLAGVSSLSLLLMIFGATAVMNLCGLVMEVHNQTTARTNWLSYIVGTIAGLGPWVVVAIYLCGANQFGSGDVPTFVYYIFGSIFIFFSSFAVNMWLQYRGIGRWSEYLYGEKVYMILSLVAKSALAWQIFAGTLRP